MIGVFAPGRDGVGPLEAGEFWFLVSDFVTPIPGTVNTFIAALGLCAYRRHR